MVEHRNSSQQNVVSKDADWRRRVDMETISQRNFSREHGYMLKYIKGGAFRRADPAPTDSLDTFAAGSKALVASYDGNLSSMYNMRRSRPRLGNTVDRIVGLPSLDGCAAPAGRAKQSDSVEAFLEAYLKRAPGVPRPAPQDLYATPILSSHRVGWGKSLELCNTGGFRLR
mmetsp:Transcript_45062/g.115252  ORF Transcript_45062/g.115252 Transcript_45062/m.115252 type:complete len:171 (-) Transcript_45062:35-547(-)|eukprot:jgi/Tetstr1/426315/TSEL_016631.t1